MDFSGLKDIVKDLTQGAEQRAVSRALKCFAKGQLDKAIEILAEARQASPENADILFDLCRYYVLANRGAEAAEALRGALRRHPRAYRRATELIEELRAKHAPVSPLYDAIAEHFVRHDDLKNALESYEKMRPEEIKAQLPRLKGKWESHRKNEPDAKLAKPSLQSAYSLALSYEALREYDPASTIYRQVVKTNPEELPRIIERLEAVLARDYQNAALRCAVGDLMLRAGREPDAVQQFTLVLETDPRGGQPVAERLREYLHEKGEKHDLRWVMVTGLLAAGDDAAAIDAMRPLVEAGALLNQVVQTLETLSAGDRDKEGRARLLLATALAKRGHPQSAVDILTSIAEEKGLRAVREPLEAIAKAQPKSARVFHMLADLHLSEARPEEAVQCLRQARELAPQEEGLLVPRLTRILEANPSAAEAHLLLADLLIKSGERDRAVVVLRHAVSAAPAASAETLVRFAAILKDATAPPRAHIGAAEACLALKKYPEALRHLREAGGARPDLTAEFLRLVPALAEASPEHGAGAADFLRELAATTAHPLAVRFALGETLFFAGQVAPAGAVFRDLLQAAPERIEEIRVALLRFDRDSPEAAEARVVLALLCLDKRDFKGAFDELSRGGTIGGALLERLIAKYDEILAAVPDDVDARAGFIEALLMAKQYDRVLSIGTETVKLRDDESTARVSLAMADALRHKGDPDAAVKRIFAAYGRNKTLAGAAIDRLKGIVETEGTHPLASLALGKVLGAEGRAPEAVEALSAARAADPKMSDAVLTELQRLRDAFPTEPQPGLALLNILAETDDHKRSVEVISALLDARPDLASVLAGHLDRILKADPQMVFAAFEMGRALQHLKLLPRSAQSFLQAFRLDASLAPMILKRLQETIASQPTSPDAYLAACAIHAARGKLQAAAEKIDQALAKMPGEAERLLPRLEEIQRQNPGSPTITVLFADACLRAGKHERALQAFADAAQRDAGLADHALAGVEAVLKAAPKLAAGYLARARLLSQRMAVDQATGDMAQAARLDPGLGPRVLEEAEALRARAPEAHALALLLSDHYAAAQRDNDAVRVLNDQMGKGGGRNERLALLVRLWRLAAARGDDESAQAYLAEASGLAPDRNRFLLRVHETRIAVMRASAARLREQAERGTRRGADLQAALRLLLDLGDLGQAETLLDKGAGQIEGVEMQRLRGEIALRRGDYARAAAHLMNAGATRALAFAAAQAGDFALAARTLETIARDNPEPGLDASLHRIYRELVAADLMHGRRRLVGETTVRFAEENAA